MYWLACGASYRVTADAFGMPFSTVCRKVHGVVKEMMAILQKVCPQGGRCLLHSAQHLHGSRGYLGGGACMEEIDDCILWQNHDYYYLFFITLFIGAHHIKQYKSCKLHV